MTVEANGAVNAPYAMSKAGVESFARALRSELAGTGTLFLEQVSA